jgi:hypothetical protein
MPAERVCLGQENNAVVPPVTFWTLYGCVANNSEI